ncbi:DgyrCDS5754 [Dimorphilus gyrociliatus]|uniref:DgyrCDS5754 n=1 Tax=Dimorphilus gyrociliatus TaxID=2664684 RepID=A0A7I8VNK2_9ANNE|nr:DgyrCDS5754 [Dimorphilus gyrociliatus]
MASSGVSTIYQLFFTYGILTGFGNGLMYFSSMVAVQHYFDKKRALATGLAVSGSGVGMLVFSLLTRILLDKFQLRWTLICEGIIMLLGIVCGILLRPLADHSMGYEQENLLLKEKEEKEAIKETKINSCILSITNFLKGFFDPTLFLDMRYCLFITCFFIYNFGMIAPYTYIPERATEVFNIDTTRSAFLISIIGISNVSSRLLFAWIGDLGKSIRFLLGLFLLFSSGIVTIFISFYTDYKTMIIYSVIFGALSGSWISLLPVILVDIVSIDKIEKGFGLLCSFSSFALLFAGPLCGWLIDKTQNFDSTFYLVGIMQLISGVVFSFNKLVEYLDERRSSKTLQDESQTLLKHRRNRSYVSISYA